MEPQSGQFVKLIFRNATQMEGTVVEWSDTKSVLKSTDKENLLVIMQTAQDVMAYKIVVDHMVPETIPQKFEELATQFQEVYEQPSNDDLRTKKLAQLKIAMIDHEKKIVAHNLSKHVPSQVNGVSYGSPFTQQRTK